jgi:hypothetical protein
VLADAPVLGFSVLCSCFSFFILMYDVLVQFSLLQAIGSGVSIYQIIVVILTRVLGILLCRVILVLNATKVL